MSAESGRKVAVGIGRETTRGTAVAPSYWIKHLEQNLKPSAEKAYNDSGVGVLDKYNSADVIKELGGGPIGGKVTDRSFPLILAAAFGQAPSTAANADSTYTHTFAQSQSNQSLALTLALKDSNRDERYALGMLQSLEINIAAGDWVKFTADFLSKKPSTAAGNTVAYIEENEFKAKHVTIKLADNVAGLAAATAIPVKEGSLTIDRAVEDYPVVTTNEPHDIFAQELEISGDLTLLYESNTYREDALGDGYQAMSITLSNEDATIGTASANPSITLVFPRVSLKEWDVDQGLANMVEQTVGLQMLYSSSDGHSMTGTVTNTASSY